MANRHVIGTLSVTVEARQQTEGYDRQQAVTDWVLSDRLWQDLSAVFDQLVPDGQVLTIPQLELTVHARSEEALRLALTDQFREAISRLVRNHNGEATVWSARQHTRHQIESFLETGRRLWSTLATDTAFIASWFRQLSDGADAEFIQFLRNRSTTNPSVWLRFVYALGLENVQRFVLAQLPDSTRQTQWLTELIEHQRTHLSTFAQAVFWQTVFEHSPLAQTDERTFANRVQAALSDTLDTGQLSVRTVPNQTPTRANPAQAHSNRTHSDKADNQLPVSNAGLVLLGPFIPALFRWLGLVDGGEFRDGDACCRSIHLLQYMTTGETDAWEFDLTLNKVLCGWPMDKPVPRTVDLTTHDYEGADKALRHILEKWPLVRTTEALQTTFLQREGTLTALPEGDWRLQVERKTVDILMTRPPRRAEAESKGPDETSYPSEWTFSLLKFPWMTRMLFVDW